MDELKQPKGFGEILDLTFRLCKNRFSDFFLILLIVVGPVYLLQALVLWLSGTSFFKQMGGGYGYFQQILSGLNEDDALATVQASDIWTLILGFISSILLAVALGAVLYGVQHMKNQQDFTAGIVIKQAFSRFWGIFGSSLLFGLIAFGMIFVPFIFVGIFVAISAMAAPIAGILLGILLFFGVSLVVVLLLIRWSLYLGSVVIEKNAPGLGRSWHLTRKRTWKTLGMFIVIIIITTVIEMAVGGAVGAVLGGSVLYTMIANLIGLFTNMILFIVYAIIYNDFKTRHDGEDLREMIEDYDGLSH